MSEEKNEKQRPEQEPHQQSAEKQDKPAVENGVDVKGEAQAADAGRPVSAEDAGEMAAEKGETADAGEKAAEKGETADVGEKDAEISKTVDAGEKAAEISKTVDAVEKAAETGHAAQAAGADAPAKKTLTPEERAAKRAAAAAAKAEKDGSGDSKTEKPAKPVKPAAAKDESKTKDEAAEEKPKEPSPNQPLLDKLMASIQEGIGNDVIEEGYINELDGHLPVIVVNSDRWFKTAVYLKEQHRLNYLINLSGVDRETHLEVVYHIESFETNEQICVTVKTDRDAPSIPSVTPVWSTANWPEREVYDLLGVDFPGHPDLRRIMMPDDWVGHPLRKDYEPLDPEV